MGELPASETQGIGTLEPQGPSCWGNLPPPPKGYISRLGLERELYEVLANERHPMVTLVGRGGIGKTWLALSVLQRVAQEQAPRYTAIIWLSARDIDLLPEGPKVVRPQVVTVRDLAEEFAELFGPAARSEKTFDAAAYMQGMLRNSTIGPVLLVVDNFETVRSPLDVFVWLDTHVRLPNKVLITSRYHEFKADYPVEVHGMTDAESHQLIKATASSLGVLNLITDTIL